jgi:hypothetical protein
VPRAIRHHLRIKVNDDEYPVYSPSVRIHEQNDRTIIEADLDGIFPPNTIQGNVIVLAAGSGGVEESFPWGEAQVSFKPLRIGNTRFRAVI